MDKKRFSLVPIQHADVFGQVLERVEALVDGAAQTPGQKLPSERELSERLQVSRTSVRQALKILEASGRVESRKGSGTYVTGRIAKLREDQKVPEHIDRHYMRQLVVARSHIEKAIFEEYCFNSTRAGLAIVEDLVTRQIKSIANEERSGLDLEFEALIADLLGNAILKQMQSEIHRLWIYAWNAYGFEPEKWELLREEHLHIFKALKDRDSALLLTLLDRHINKDI